MGKKKKSCLGLHTFRYYDAAENSRLWPFLSIWPWKGNGFYEMEKKKTKTNLPLNGVKVKVIEPRTKRLFSNRNKGRKEVHIVATSKAFSPSLHKQRLHPFTTKVCNSKDVISTIYMLCWEIGF